MEKRITEVEKLEIERDLVERIYKKVCNYGEKASLERVLKNVLWDIDYILKEEKKND